MVAARDKKGRFLPGHNIPGPGRATRSREENLIGVLADVCTPDKWEKICARAVRDSIRGDDKARRWV